MKGAKYILTAAVITMSSVMMTGCFADVRYSSVVLSGTNFSSVKYSREISRFHLATSIDRKSTRLNSSHWNKSRMPSSA